MNEWVLYLSIYLFIYLFVTYLFFSLTYLAFCALPSLTIYFILVIMYLFHYLIMFLTCSSLCYNIIYLIFMHLLYTIQLFKIKN